MVSGENQRLLHLERLMIRALCQASPESSVRDSARRILRDYHWREPQHQAVFDLLMSIATADPQLIRDQLPARLTRRGFPDFDLEDFFRPSELSQEEALRLMQQIKKESTDVHALGFEQESGNFGGSAR